MGPNGAIGASFILLACLAAQSESVLDLIETGSSYGDDKRKNNEILEENIVTQGGLVEGDDDSPGGETVPLSVLDELEVDMLL